MSFYQEVLIEESNSTRNRGTLGEKAKRVCLNNPLCGDEVQLSVELEGKKLKDVRFEGQGCLISQAGTSLMCDRVRGKSCAEVEELLTEYQKMLSGLEYSRKDELGDLTLLEGVQKFPARQRCALLGFEALTRALAEQDE